METRGKADWSKAGCRISYKMLMKTWVSGLPSARRLAFRTNGAGQNLKCVLLGWPNKAVEPIKFLEYLDGGKLCGMGPLQNFTS